MPHAQFCTTQGNPKVWKLCIKLINLPNQIHNFLKTKNPSLSSFIAASFIHTYRLLRLVQECHIGPHFGLFGLHKNPSQLNWYQKYPMMTSSLMIEQDYVKFHLDSRIAPDIDSILFDLYPSVWKIKTRIYKDIRCSKITCT